MLMNNLLISGTILKEKAISYARELQVEEFHVLNRWLRRWKVGNPFEYIKQLKDNFSLFSDPF